ncbi:MAG TPA: LapA family protein [Ktedonobacterales bacterium]|nr:LapA family protein [Ktedonobacterales bacterium]
MRAFRNRVSVLLACAVVVVLAIFAIGNLTPVRVQFVGQFFPANLWWIVAGSALLGALVSFFLLAPGRVAAGWRNRILGRAGARREQDVRTMQEQHQQLQAEHSVLQAQQGQLQANYRQVQGERDAMQAQLVPVYRGGRRVRYPRSWRIDSVFISPLIRLVRFAPNVQPRQPMRLPSGCAFRPVQRAQPVSGDPVPVHAAGAAR